MEFAVDLRDVTFQYRAQSEPTLRGVSLQIRHGEKVAIVGQSGSGKSTIAHLINGLIPHRYPGTISGSVHVMGNDPTRIPIHETAKRVGTVLQDSDGQFVGLTVEEDIAFALENDIVRHPELRQRVEEAARHVEIDHRLTTAPHDLSGGQKQRVAMAGVLVDNVDILLFDEPLASLDPASGRATIDTISRLHQRTGATVIIIEHRLEDVLRADLDRIIVVDRGQIVADGSPQQIIASRVLTQHGIREPLYVTALRLTGVDVEAKDEPSSVDGIAIPEEAAQILRSWGCDHTENEPGEIQSILEVSNVDFSLNGTPILTSVSAQIERGSITALCGTNGAGKTTLAKIICGFEHPDSGRVIFDGDDITDTSITERGQRIGYVIQNPNQMISQPFIRDEVALALDAAGIQGSEKDDRMEVALRTCGLWAYRNWPVSALSYGQRKRVTIASVMVMNPQLLIMDEPTAGQDWAHYTEIMDFLRELNDRGTTILLITHDMHLVVEYTDSAIIMTQGSVIAHDRPSRVLSTPALTQQASLVTTSLDALARRVSHKNPSAFIDDFITRETQWRERILADHLGTGR